MEVEHHEIAESLRVLYRDSVLKKGRIILNPQTRQKSFSTEPPIG